MVLFENIKLIDVHLKHVTSITFECELQTFFRKHSDTTDIPMDIIMRMRVEGRTKRRRRRKEKTSKEKTNVENDCAQCEAALRYFDIIQTISR